MQHGPGLPGSVVDPGSGSEDDRAMRRFALGLLSFSAADCSSGGGPGGDALDDLPDAVLADDTATATRWAQMGSSPQVYGIAYSMVGAADFAIDLGATCPTKTESDTRVTYTGGCTDEDGDMWVGTATVDSDPNTGDNTITYTGFGLTG